MSSDYGDDQVEFGWEEGDDDVPARGTGRYARVRLAQAIQRGEIPGHSSSSQSPVLNWQDQLDAALAPMDAAVTKLQGMGSPAEEAYKVVLMDPP